MLAVTLASLALTGLVVLLAYTRDRWLARAFDRERQGWYAREETLVNQVCHVAGKPWSPPPVREPRPARVPDPDRELAEF